MTFPEEFTHYKPARHNRLNSVLSRVWRASRGSVWLHFFLEVSSISDSLNQRLHLQSRLFSEASSLEMMACYCKELLLMFKPFIGMQTCFHAVTLPSSSSKLSKQHIPVQKRGLVFIFLQHPAGITKVLINVSTVHLHCLVFKWCGWKLQWPLLISFQALGSCALLLLNTQLLFIYTLMPPSEGF